MLQVVLGIDKHTSIIICVKLAVQKIRKQVELSFNKDNHHKSGRSGCHGKKFNIISSTITRKKNDLNYLKSTKCFNNDKDKLIVIKEFEKQSKIYHNKAKSINHR